jgi:nitroimidazol reductase NimA-like FMN-containing flavoprotein (pyridoxamine 5'-phosphate oxidase superfamily)
MVDEAGLDEDSIGRAGMPRGTDGLLQLSSEDCWAHLKGRGFGRLAIVVEGVPRIFPLNYAAHGDTVVFRTDAGAKLRHGPGATACLEIDGYDPREAMGWSVMATGRLADITDSKDQRAAALRALPLVPSAPGERGHWLALEVAEVSGRFFRRGWLGPANPR